MTRVELDDESAAARAPEAGDDVLLTGPARLARGRVAITMGDPPASRDGVRGLGEIVGLDHPLDRHGRLLPGQQPERRRGGIQHREGDHEDQDASEDLLAHR
jgi:hypothetical protein